MIFPTTDAFLISVIYYLLLQGREKEGLLHTKKKTHKSSGLQTFFVMHFYQEKNFEHAYPISVSLLEVIYMYLYT